MEEPCREPLDLKHVSAIEAIAAITRFFVKPTPEEVEALMKGNADELPEGDIWCVKTQYESMLEVSASIGEITGTITLAMNTKDELEIFNFESKSNY